MSNRAHPDFKGRTEPKTTIIDPVRPKDEVIVKNIRLCIIPPIDQGFITRFFQINEFFLCSGIHPRIRSLCRDAASEMDRYPVKDMLPFEEEDSNSASDEDLDFIGEAQENLKEEQEV